MAKYLRYFGYNYSDELGRESSWRARSAPNCVFDLFELEFRKSPSHDVTKLTTFFTQDPTKHLSSQLLAQILDVYVHLDLQVFSHYDVEQQKRFYLDSILLCLESYADEYGWDKEHCRNTYRKILDLSITFDRFWKKPIRNRATGYSTQIHVSYFDSIDVTLVVFDKKKTPMKKKLLARLPGTIGALEDAHGKLVWHDDTHVRLYRKNERDFWEYDMTTDSVDFHFPRAESGDPHGQYDLGVMYLDGWLVFPDREKALRWIRLAAEQGFKRAVKRLERLQQEE